MNQRWRDGQMSFRFHARIDTRQFDVAPIAERDAKAFVLHHHYSGSYPAARFRFGLHRHGQLAGVAVFSVPCSAGVLTSVFPGDFRDSVELGRFVLLDEVPGNGETWFLARCFEQLRAAGLRGVVSFSDPVPRARLDGSRIFPGHVGTIYQAHNGRYLGRGTARTLRILPNGRVLSDRAIQKIRAGERGWHHAASQLEILGAAPCSDDPRAWLREWLPRLTRTLRHPGNHKYAWPLQPRIIPVGTLRPYPKQVDP